MDPTIIVSIIAVIPVTITAIAGLILALKTHKQGCEIHTLVNANLAQLKADLAAALAQVTRLEEEKRKGEHQL